MPTGSPNAWSSLNPRRDLATRLAFLAFGGGVVVAAILAEVAAGELQRTLAARVGFEFENVAAAAGRNFDDFMAGRFGALQKFATAPTFIAPEATAEQRRGALSALVAEGQAAWVGFADASGNLVAGSDGLLEGTNVAGQAWFRNGSIRAYRGSPHADAELNRATGSTVHFLEYGLPVRDAGGRLLGVIGVQDYWTIPIAAYALPEGAAEGQIIASLYRRPPEGLWLLDSRNREADRQLRVPLTRGAPRGSLRESIAGRDWIVGYAVNPADDFPIVMAVRQPADLAFAQVRGLRIRLLEWGVAAAVLAMIPTYIAGRRITRKLRLLAGTADRIATGDPLTVMPSFAPPDQLARATECLANLVEVLKAEKNSGR